MLENCLLLAGVMLLGMASPGPDFLLVLKNSCVGSRPYGYGTALGITLGIMVHLFYCALGLGIIISKSIVAYSVVKYLGACYLVYIGIKSLLSKSAPTPRVDQLESSEQRNPRTWGNGIKEGFLCNALNPKATVFFVSVISQFFKPGIHYTEMAIYCGLIVILNTLYWLSIVSLLQRDIVQHFLSASRAVLDRLFGGILIALGVRVALSD